MRSRTFAAVAVIVTAAAALGAVTASNAPRFAGAVSRVFTSSPVDDASIVAVADLTQADASPYQPATVAAAAPTRRIPMIGYTGLVIRAKYPRGETITAPTVHLWAYKGGDWYALQTVDGLLALSLDDAASDCDDGTTWKWTVPSSQIDALGAPEILATVQTAATASSGGAVSLEIARF